MTASRRGAVAGLAQFAGQQTEDNGVASPTLERHVGAQHALTAESASLGDALESMAIYGHIRTTRRCRDRRPPIAQVAALHAGHASAAGLWTQPEADCCPPLIGLDVLQRRAAQD